MLLISERSYVDIQCATLTTNRHVLYIEWRFTGVEIESLRIYSAITLLRNGLLLYFIQQINDQFVFGSTDNKQEGASKGRGVARDP